MTCLPESPCPLHGPLRGAYDRLTGKFLGFRVQYTAPTAGAQCPVCGAVRVTMPTHVAAHVEHRVGGLEACADAGRVWVWRLPTGLELLAQSVNDVR